MQIRSISFDTSAFQQIDAAETQTEQAPFAGDSLLSSLNKAGGSLATSSSNGDLQPTADDGQPTTIANKNCSMADIACNIAKTLKIIEEVSDPGYVKPVLTGRYTVPGEPT